MFARTGYKFPAGTDAESPSIPYPEYLLAPLLFARYQLPGSGLPLYRHFCSDLTSCFHIAPTRNDAQTLSIDLVA